MVGGKVAGCKWQVAKLQVLATFNAATCNSATLQLPLCLVP